MSVSIGPIATKPAVELCLIDCIFAAWRLRWVLLPAEHGHQYTKRIVLIYSGRRRALARYSSETPTERCRKVLAPRAHHKAGSLQGTANAG